MKVAEQVAVARQRALAVPRDDMVTLVASGKDRVSWLNGLVTCDLTKAAPGHASYGLAVARNGRILTDLTVVTDEAEATLLVTVPRSASEELRTHLDHYIVMEEVELTAGGYRAWAIHGPGAGDVLAVARGGGATGGELDVTGLGGAFLLVPSEKAKAVETALAEHASLGDESGWEALRLERGVPRFGVDFDDKTYPQEASVEKAAVSFEKGCYLGQEVVFMLEKRGHVKRRLVSLVLDPSAPAPGTGAPVTDEAGAPIGEVTSAAQSPTLGTAVALAMLKRVHAVAGQGVVVGGARGKVVERPA
jgi:folate-binding protein YgfZ